MVGDTHRVQTATARRLSRLDVSDSGEAESVESLKMRTPAATTPGSNLHALTEGDVGGGHSTNYNNVGAWKSLCYCSR